MPRPPRVYKTPAIVLRQRRLGDADKIVTLYTANHGKLDAVAKGVRRVKSRLAGHVEPLNHGSFLLAHGRNLDIITQAQTIESFQPLRNDLDRLSRALYAAELLDRSTEERAENFALYRLLLDTLRRLAQRDDLDLVLRFFEMSLLGQLGYRPELGQCVVCGRPLEAEENAWAPGASGVVCPRCQPGETALRPLSLNAFKLLRLLQGGRFQEVARVRIAPELGSELERHLRDAIHHALDRDVRSAAFLDMVRRKPRARPANAIRSAGPR
ncbi:MAG: DNA repair protein RecO [Chloroflexi bacterium RBG_16_68_14]|nr:MAG: DNA repair protein RecO [Chloroflexi bacterium RBG_16_68_14]